MARAGLGPSPGTGARQPQGRVPPSSPAPTLGGRAGNGLEHANNAHLQLLVAQTAGCGSDAHQIGARRDEGRVGGCRFGHEGAELSTEPVAAHRVPHRPPDGIGHPGWTGRGGRNIGQRKRAGARPTGAVAELEEGATVRDTSDQADRRSRPFWRRARNTARPARVDMRCRNPCRLARLRTLGWYVRFTGCLLGHASLLRLRVPPLPVGR